MAYVEFEMRTDIANVTPNELAFNFDELKAWLSSNLANDTSIVLREEDIPDAKARRAQINKVSKAINDAKIATKKQYLTPYEKFETQCKELIGMCNKASANLGDQLAKFDNIRIENKINELKEYFAENIGELDAYLTFDNIYNSRWGNVTFSIDEAKKEIASVIDNTKADITAIKAFNSEFEIALLDCYKDTRSLTNVVNKKTSLEQAKMRIEAQAAMQAEAERKAAEEALKPVEKIAKEFAPETIEPIKQDIVDNINKTVAMQIDFRVWVTSEQLADLKQFLVSHNIKYGKVK